MLDKPDPSEGGVAVPSTLNPGKTAYLRYYFIRNPKNQLDEKFIDTLLSLSKIGTLTESKENALASYLYQFCEIWDYMRNSMKLYNSLFIISGTNSDDAKLHSVITFYCKQVDNKPTLIVDAFCSNQQLKKKVENHGGRILFETINRACKKMKIKQINLDAVDKAVPWYLSKGFVQYNKTIGFTQMTKKVSPRSRSSSSPKKPVKKTSKKSNSSNTPIKKTSNRDLDTALRWLHTMRNYN